MNTAFKHQTSEDWKALLVKENKGAGWEELTWTSPEGLLVRPFYTALDRPEIPPMAPKGWQTLAEVGPADDATLRQAIELRLALGANGLIVYGLPENNFASVFEGIDTQLVALYLVTEGPLPQPIPGVFSWWDPLENYLRTGRPLVDLPTDLADASPVVLGNYLAACGAQPALQLATMLQHGHELLVARGAEWARNMTFVTAVGTDFLLEVAKIKALRLLWQHLLARYGIQGTTFIVAENALRYYSATDLETNMLRSATAAMAARAGGADAVLTHPFDGLAPQSEQTGLRMALNQQFLMQYEGRWPMDADPSAGSYAMDQLTRQLAEAAWKEFAALEQLGTFSANIQSGAITQRVKQHHLDEIQQLTSGNVKRVGINAFRKQPSNAVNTIEMQGPWGLQPIRVAQYFDQP
jgi:methylmalonyl-CoA mutase